MLVSGERNETKEALGIKGFTVTEDEGSNNQ